MFSKPDVIALASERFVPVAVNDLRLYRLAGPEGDFYRGLVDPLPVTFAGDPSHQGIFCASASGSMLAYVRNMSTQVDGMDLMREALEAFAALPRSQRAPGAVRVAAGSATSDQDPPEDGLILRAYTRRLQGSGDALRASAVPLVDHAMAIEAEPQPDHVWLTKAECDSLVPSALTPGAATQMPAALARRLCAFHLADTTLEGSTTWALEDIQACSARITVERVVGDIAWLSLRGQATVERKALPGQVAIRMHVALRGHLRCDLASRRLSGFDLVGIGDMDVLSDGGKASGVLGFAFEVADGTRAGDRVPPHDGHGLAAYRALMGDVRAAK